VDPTDGGETSRYSLSGEWHRNDGSSLTKVSVFAMHYKLKLFSNFTYALDNPVDGDQFSQQDNRNVVGLRAGYSFGHTLGGLNARSEIGTQLRVDRIHVGLFDSVARSITATTRSDQVSESLVGVYGQTDVEFTPLLRGVFGLRADRLHASVESLSLAANSGTSSGHLISPKLSLIAGPFANTEFFFNAGRAFHSNDVRGTTITIDPRTGDPVDKVPALVSAKGLEFGVRTEAVAGLQSSLALWQLKSNSELVYVGDAGTTEPQGASTRRGVEFNNRWIPVPWFLLDADIAWTHARFDNGDRIPNAIDRVASLAATVPDLGRGRRACSCATSGPVR
jgi:hypothetical protein